MIRDEGADRVEVGNSDVSGSEDRGGDQSDTATDSERGDADESGRSPTPSRRVRTRVCFDQIDCRPTIYHPGGIFEELAPLPPGLLRDPRAQSWGNVFVRHPNTIACPDKFFESAQAIAAHSHLRWPDLNREGIRRQQARIARVDWESRLPCVLGPRKSRLPLFTCKQQRLLDKAREMDGVPDLSPLLKGKLQLLSKKSTKVDPQGPPHSGVDVTSEGGGTSREGASKEGAFREEGPITIYQGGRAETSASGPKKKKKSKKTKVGTTDEAPPEESASLDATSEGSKAKKKKDGRKRSRGGEASSADRGESLAEGQEAILVRAAPDGHPKKRTKRSVEAEPRPSTSDANAADATFVYAVGEASGTPENLSEERRKTSSREGGCGELEGKLKSASAAKKELARENTRLEQAAATLEKEKTELLEERDAAVEKLIGERQRLRDSRGLEVTHERERVEAAMVEKAYRCFGRPLVDVTSVPAEHVEVPEGGGLDERRENTENVGIEEHVLVSDSSSEGREDEEEEDDRVEETSPSYPVEEETTNEVGNRDVPPPPSVASLVPVPTRVEDPTAAATEDPVGPSALGTPKEDGQDSAP
ncbi:hypothetical protein HID58_087265 [Brassica napus]|uniref:Uncharacterized protein n=1 Tax=Brassica napus TaxID=3708 RepID=A0ABQ7XU55_BRANA|nr:hypothetical protein HID58_087265 [Brassica napus]